MEFVSAVVSVRTGLVRDEGTHVTFYVRMCPYSLLGSPRRKPCFAKFPTTSMNALGGVLP